jgi:hypothetical protein
MTENTAPALQQTIYYSKAVSSLCRSASRFQQAAKRKTILEMISQERERREHVEQLRQEHMGSIFKSKSNSRLDLAETQSSARRELEALRDRNSLMRKLCRRSIEESRLTDFKRKRESADSVRALLESSHHWLEPLQEQAAQGVLRQRAGALPARQAGHPQPPAGQRVLPRVRAPAERL